MIHEGISIVITAHDRKEFIGQAIESVRQSMRDQDEIVVVTNLTEDQVFLNGYVRPDNARYIHTKAQPFGTKLNLGIKNAKNDIISFLDDDDIFLPNKLDIVRSVFQNDTVFFKDSARGVFLPSRKYITMISYPIHHLSLLGLGDLLNHRADWNVSNMSIRKSLVNSIDLLKNKKWSLDKLLFYMILPVESHIFMVNENLTWKREHQKSRMHTINRSDFYRNTAEQFRDLDTDDDENSSSEFYRNLIVVHNEFMASDKGGRMLLIPEIKNLYRLTKFRPLLYWYYRSFLGV